MKSFKYMLAGATALGLVMAASAAFAGDNNKATADQNGTGNAATITQTGSGNHAGIPNDPSANPYGHVSQTGNDNQLTILQSGDGADIAHWSGAYPSATSPGANLRQNGSQNVMSITQGGRDAVYGAGQKSDINVNFEANKLTINQDAGRHVIGFVTQTNSLINGSNADTNAVTITQKIGGTNNGNHVDSVSQDGSGDTQTISQNGTLNYVHSTAQTGASDAISITETNSSNAVYSVTQSGGNTNSATIKLTGTGNGRGTSGLIQANVNENFSPLLKATLSDFTAGGSAASVGVTQATVNQQGNRNTVNYTANSDNNLYGFSQIGDDNGIHGTSTSGASGSGSNEVAISQMGSSNETDFAQAGGGNNIGVSIFGNSNGIGGGFQGNHLGLTAGLIDQEGSLNTVSLKIGTGGTNANSNVFGFKQAGDQNSITGTVTGNGNQAAVLQGGSLNVASFTQTGVGSNTVVIHQ